MAFCDKFRTTRQVAHELASEKIGEHFPLDTEDSKVRVENMTRRFVSTRSKNDMVEELDQKYRKR